MRWPMVTSVLLFVIIASALDPPNLVWEVETPPWILAIKHIVESQSDGFIGGAVPSSNHKPIIRFDEEGNVLWDAGVCGDGFAMWVEELGDGSVVAAGWGSDPEYTISGLLITKVTADGDPVWGKIYTQPGVSDVHSITATCLTLLPDNGFAVCGWINNYDALLLRTDAYGDTLWTRVFDAGGGERARRVIYYNNGLTVFITGGGMHGFFLVRYDMDGNILWERNYHFFTVDEWAGDMCLASDNGYVFISACESEIAHTDWLGYLIWHKPILIWGVSTGMSISTTMDNGYIFSGWDDPYYPPGTRQVSPTQCFSDTTCDGWLVKLDSLGNSQWNILNETGRYNYFNCARQLQDGGYIVGGQIWDIPTTSWNGYLLRYAPETGVEEGEVAPDVIFDISPNPFSASLGISYSLPEPVQVDLCVYDLSGRLIEDLVNGPISVGECNSIWTPDPSLPNGCYLIVLDTYGERVVKRVVRLR